MRLGVVLLAPVLLMGAGAQATESSPTSTPTPTTTPATSSSVAPGPAAETPPAPPVASMVPPPGSVVPTPGSSPLPSPPPAPRPADQVDRAWPARPPWDACPRPVWPGARSVGLPGQGRRVLVIGDSLTRESRVETQRLLRASGWTPTFRCWGSRRLDWGIAQVDRARRLGQLPGVVVLALGTNDISWETPATTTRRVRTLLERIGPTRDVLWVDLDVDHSSFTRERAAWFNRFIRAEARARSNLTVLGWEGFARSRRAARYDGIHYGERGYRLRAEFLARALDAQARRRG